MDFGVIGKITGIKIIAVDRNIRELSRLQKMYGKGRWRKMKGYSMVRLKDGTIHKAELHWYEAHGIGKRDMKIKLPFLD